MVLLFTTVISFQARANTTVTVVATHRRQTSPRPTPPFTVVSTTGALRRCQRRRLSRQMRRFDVVTATLHHDQPYRPPLLGGVSSGVNDLLARPPSPQRDVD